MKYEHSIDVVPLMAPPQLVALFDAAANNQGRILVTTIGPIPVAASMLSGQQSPGVMLVYRREVSAHEEEPSEAVRESRVLIEG